MNQTTLTILIVCLFPVVFIPWWCFICWMIGGFSGWRRIAATYPAVEDATGTRFGAETGRVGLSNYKGVLVVHTTPTGMHLSVWTMFRPGHPPLFIPSSAVHNLRRRHYLWLELVAFDVGQPSIATVQLSKSVMATMPGVDVNQTPAG